MLVIALWIVTRLVLFVIDINAINVVLMTERSQTSAYKAFYKICVEFQHSMIKVTNVYECLILYVGIEKKVVIICVVYSLNIVFC